MPCTDVQCTYIISVFEPAIWRNFTIYPCIVMIRLFSVWRYIAFARRPEAGSAIYRADAATCSLIKTRNNKRRNNFPSSASPSEAKTNIEMFTLWNTAETVCCLRILRWGDEAVRRSPQIVRLCWKYYAYLNNVEYVSIIHSHFLLELLWTIQSMQKNKELYFLSKSTPNWKVFVVSK